MTLGGSSNESTFTGAEHLYFACNGCGDCCRRHRVALTHHDLARLGSVVSEPIERLVNWLAPAEVDFDAESASFVTLPSGPRLMVLARVGAACRFLTADNRCRVYSARPRDCELYPFVLEHDDRRRPVRLALFEPEGCGERAAMPRDVGTLASADAERWAEVDEYRALVNRWNRLARHRRRFGHRAGTAGEFLAFIGAGSRREPMSLTVARS
jgi:Fe-S-cluster containining protein